MDTNKKVFKIGTRGSALALWQAREVAAQLQNLQVETELIIIRTSGDRFKDIPLQGQAETGFFTKEIENRLAGGEIDIAVHSLKDLPTKSDPNLTIGAYLPRAAVNDILLIHPDWIDETAVFPVKPGCTVGATSLRRQALVRLYAPRAEPKMLRGNVPTRITKCREEQYGAIVLAQAGVQRLQLDVNPLTVYQLSLENWLPAPGQGAVAVQARKNDDQLLPHLAKIDHRNTRDAVHIERQLLANFEGGCHTAFGSYALKNNGAWRVAIGLDRGEEAWGQVTMENFDIAATAEVTPTSITGYIQPAPTKQENLCCKILL
ncbi:MAG: hydroxymethylbilane synthase [bacterium]|nr:hydroxymethylbilane synthase [bacterium]